MFFSINQSIERRIMQSNQIQTKKMLQNFSAKSSRGLLLVTTRAKKHIITFSLSIGEYQQIYHHVFNKSTIFFPSSISSICPLYFLSLSLSNNYFHNRLFFALRMNGLKDHSMSASSWSTVPNFSWYNRNSNLGPISFKCKDFGPFGMS